MHELEAGKRVNARSYTMMVQERSRGSVQVGSRVPIATGQGAQFQYQSVGMTIECRPIGRDGSVSLDLHVDVEGLLKPEEAGLSAAERNPVFRTNIFRSEAVIPLGKPTVVGAMDDVASNRRYEIEVTATKVR